MIEIVNAHQASGLPDNYQERQLMAEILYHWHGFLLCPNPLVRAYMNPIKEFP